MNRPKSKFLHNFYKFFLIIVLVMFTVNLGLVLYVMRDYRSASQKEDSDYLTSICGRIAWDLDDGIQDLVMTLFQPSEYNKYIYASRNTKNKYGTFLSLKDELSRMLYGTRNIYSDCAMYYPDTEELVSGNHGYFQLSRAANQSYRDTYNIDQTGAYQRELNIVANPAGASVLATITYQFESGAMIIFTIDNDYFDSLFGNPFSSQETGGILISDSMGNIVYTSGVNMGRWLSDRDFLGKVTALSAGSRSIARESTGESYLCTLASIDSLMLKITKLKQETAIGFLQQYSRLLFFFILLTLAAFLVGIYITYRFSNKAYKPVKGLINSIKPLPGFEGPEKDGGLDEFKLIEDYMADSKIELNEMRRILDSNKAVIKEKFIKYLLMNEQKTEGTTVEYSSVLGVRFDRECYTAVHLVLDQNVLARKSYLEKNLLKMRLIYEIEEFSPDGQSFALACEFGESSLAVVIASDTAAGHDTVLSYIRCLETCLRNHYDVPYFIAAGIGQSRPEDLPASYRAARKVGLCHFYTEPDISFCDAGETGGADQAAFDAFVSLAEKHEPGFSGIRFLIGEALKLYGRYPYDAENCKKALTAAVSYIVRVFEKEHITVKEKGMEKVIYPQENFWKASEYFSYIIGLLPAQGSDASETPGNLINRVNRYIACHLDGELSLDSIAEHVALQPKYLSKVYKEQSGKNLTSYIMEKRIETAVGLLKNTNKNIETIAYETGFSSSNYFIKCFKAQMGLTPKAYKETLTAEK